MARFKLRKGNARLLVFIDCPDYLFPETLASIPIEVINRGCDLSHVRIAIQPGNDKLSVNFHEYIRLLPRGERARFTVNVETLKLGIGELIIDISAVDENYNELHFTKKIRIPIHISPPRFRKLLNVLVRIFEELLFFGA